MLTKVCYLITFVQLILSPTSSQAHIKKMANDFIFPYLCNVDLNNKDTIFKNVVVYGVTEEPIHFDFKVLDVRGEAAWVSTSMDKSVRDVQRVQDPHVSACGSNRNQGCNRKRRYYGSLT